MVGRRQPEEQRKVTGLDAEAAEQQQGRQGQVDRGFGLRQHPREIRHVQRAGRPVEQCHTGEEKQRGEQVEDRVAHRRIELRAVAADRQEAHRGDQHYLEPHIEVEDVAGEEGPVDAGEHAQQQGVEAGPLLATADVSQTEGHHRGGQNSGDRHHRCRQGIGDEDYAERRRPVAEADRQNPLAIHRNEQQQRSSQQQGYAQGTDQTLGARTFPQAGCQPSTENRQQDRPEWCVQRQKSCHGRSLPAEVGEPSRSAASICRRSTLPRRR